MISVPGAENKPIEPRNVLASVFWDLPVDLGQRGQLRLDLEFGLFKVPGLVDLNDVLGRLTSAEGLFIVELDRLGAILGAGLPVVLGYCLSGRSIPDFQVLPLAWNLLGARNKVVLARAPLEVDHLGLNKSDSFLLGNNIDNMDGSSIGDCERTAVERCEFS